MKFLNNPHITIAALLAFMALAYTSQHQETSYSQDDLRAMDALVSHAVGDKRSDDFTPPVMRQEIAAQMVFLYGEK